MNSSLQYRGVQNVNGKDDSAYHQEVRARKTFCFCGTHVHFRGCKLSWEKDALGRENRADRRQTNVRQSHCPRKPKTRKKEWFRVIEIRSVGPLSLFEAGELRVGVEEFEDESCRARCRLYTNGNAGKARFGKKNRTTSLICSRRDLRENHSRISKLE
jgi:hypothetical protein